jgi:CBS domain-containing protein
MTTLRITWGMAMSYEFVGPDTGDGTAEGCGRAAGHRSEACSSDRTDATTAGDMEQKMSVRELLKDRSAAMITVSRDADVASAARLMIDHGIGGLPVVGTKGEIVGMLAERDIVRTVHEHALQVNELPVERIMRPPPTCAPGDSLQEVMSRMTRERLRHLVVVDDGEPVGLISVGDLVKYRLGQLETETGVLRDYVAAQRART